MKVYIVYENELWEFSHPLAVFSNEELAIQWIKEIGNPYSSHGIQQLELDYYPKHCFEIKEADNSYFGTE